MTTDVRPSAGERAATRRPAFSEPRRSGAPGAPHVRDRGLTFIELVVAIVLIGTVVVAVMAATRTLVISSRTNREVASMESTLLAIAEQVERAPRETYWCHEQLTPLVEGAARIQLGVTAAEVHNYVEIGYKHLETNTWVDGACPSSGYQPGLVQRLRITVTSPTNGFKRSLEVIKGDV